MIEYLLLEYNIEFETSLTWSRSPTMIFRSVLGYQLRKLTCVLKNQKCENCILNKTCVYANFFESPIEKNKEVLLGRNRAPHPFTLNVKLVDKKDAILQVLFIGQSRNYIPYITLALERAGKSGVSKSRTKYKIKSVCFDKKNYQFDISTIADVSSKWPKETLEFNYNTVQFVTPCRIKKLGHYLDNININDFIVAIERRIYILDQIYGDGSYKICTNKPNFKSHSINQRWVDLNYYSSRQKESLRIGGVIGKIYFNDPITDYYTQIFKAAEVFNVGKNISMGLGKIVLLKENF